MYINNTGRMDIMLLLTDQYLDTIHQQVMQEFQVIEDDREAQASEYNQHGYPEMEVVLIRRSR